MIDNHDECDWGWLSHAHGEAADVPWLLRSIASTDPKVRQEPIYELFGNIWHQGTVYPATAAAVPFLYELLTAPDVEDKPSIAHLLACIADGSDYLEVHAEIEIGGVTWRKILSEKGMSLEDELAREAGQDSVGPPGSIWWTKYACCRTSSTPTPKFGDPSRLRSAIIRNT